MKTVQYDRFKGWFCDHPTNTPDFLAILQHDNRQLAPFYVSALCIPDHNEWTVLYHVRTKVKMPEYMRDVVSAECYRRHWDNKTKVSYLPQGKEVSDFVQKVANEKSFSIHSPVNKKLWYPDDLLGWWSYRSTTEQRRKWLEYITSEFD